MVKKGAVFLLFLLVFSNLLHIFCAEWERRFHILNALFADINPIGEPDLHRLSSSLFEVLIKLNNNE